MTTIQVMLCVNDHRNGACTGRIDGIAIKDVIQLDGPSDFDEDDELAGTTKFLAGRYSINIGGTAFPHMGYARWVGNMVWDAATMEPAMVLHLLNHLKALGWDCIEAEERLFERWRGPGELAMEDLARAGIGVGTGGTR